MRPNASAATSFTLIPAWAQTARTPTVCTSTSGCASRRSTSCAHSETSYCGCGGNAGGRVHPALASDPFSIEADAFTFTGRSMPPAGGLERRDGASPCFLELPKWRRRRSRRERGRLRRPVPTLGARHARVGLTRRIAVHILFVLEHHAGQWPGARGRRRVWSRPLHLRRSHHLLADRVRGGRHLCDDAINLKQNAFEGLFRLDPVGGTPARVR